MAKIFFIFGAVQVKDFLQYAFAKYRLSLLLLLLCQLRYIAKRETASTEMCSLGCGVALARGVDLGKVAIVGHEGFSVAGHDNSWD